MWLDMGAPPCRDVANRREQLFRRAGLDQIAIRAGFQGAENAFAVFINRDHDDLHRGRGLFDLGDAFDPGHARQLDVHEHDIRIFCQNLRQSLLGGRKCGQTFDVGRRFKDLNELLSQAFVVFNNDD